VQSRGYGPAVLGLIHVRTTSNSASQLTVFCGSRSYPPQACRRRVHPPSGGIVAVPVEFCDRLRRSIANVFPRRDRHLSGRSSDGTVGVIDLAALDYSSCLLSQTQENA